MTRVWNHSKARGSQRLVLLAIADSANSDDGTGAWPSMETLATKVRLTRRQVQKIVDRLDASGELGVESRNGKANRFTVRVRCEREDAPSFEARCERECTPGVNRRTPPPVNGTTPRTVREPQRKQRSPSLEADTAKRLANKWRSSREDAGLERFTDPTALKWLRDAIARAFTAGCEQQDIETAIRWHVEEDFADPRQLDRWAIDVRDQRLKEEVTPAQQLERQGRNLHASVCEPGHEFEDCEAFRSYRSER